VLSLCYREERETERNIADQGGERETLHPPFTCALLEVTSIKALHPTKTSKCLKSCVCVCVCEVMVEIMC